MVEVQRKSHNVGPLIIRIWFWGFLITIYNIMGPKTLF